MCEQSLAFSLEGDTLLHTVKHEYRRKQLLIHSSYFVFTQRNPRGKVLLLKQFIN